MPDWPKHHLERAETVRLELDGHAYESDGETFVRCLESAGWTGGERSNGEPRDVRRHSSLEMDGLGEFEGCTDPVAVVIRPDGSLDVYGFVGVVDQRPEPEPPIREWTVQVTKTHYGDLKVRARTADEAGALADADYGVNADWGEIEFKVGDAFDTSQESKQ